MMDLSYNKVSSSCDSRSTTNLSTCGTRSPVVTGVSVRALVSNFCLFIYFFLFYFSNMHALMVFFVLILFTNKVWR